jgi:1-acyl-sn-glycerol-3-phosphate acyltransferase
MTISKHLRGTALLIALILDTLILCLPLYFFSILKLIPIKPLQNLCSKINDGIATAWSMVIKLGIKAGIKTKWEITGFEKLRRKDWYLILANHQSWTDIVALQYVFTNKIPGFRFFLKDQMKWVPLLGLAWWGLDFPFMKRHSKEAIAKDPSLRGKDLEKTKQSCKKFTRLPVSIVNFVEGTRFTKQKHEQQQSPYKNLLKPKAGGIACVLGSMDEMIKKIINVTIVYPEGAKNLWQFLCGEIPKIKIHLEVLEVNKKLIGDYFKDAKHQEQFKQWLNELWQAKQLRIESML